MDDSPIIFQEIPVSGGLIGHILLNRPHAHNSLTMEMTGALNRQLHTWQNQSELLFVIIEGSGDRAFCSGGDIRFLYDYALSHADKVHENFDLEYAVNATLFNFTKPYISFLNGIVMGGGIGISIYGSHRIATENIRFAMPETHIGFFPDVGMGYIFSRMHHSIGMYLALSGETLHIDDCMNLGLTTHFIHSNQLSATKQALLSADYQKGGNKNIDHILAKFSQSFQSDFISEKQQTIADCFSKNSLAEILQALEEHPDTWTTNVLNKIHSYCPTSLAVTFQHITMCKTLSFNQVLAQDLRLANALCAREDLHEGVRAAIIDKDHQPKWQPDCIENVNLETIQAWFT